MITCAKTGNIILDVNSVDAFLVLHLIQWWKLENPKTNLSEVEEDTLRIISYSHKKWGLSLAETCDILHDIYKVNEAQ